ncbi:hypothetical protein T03_10850 [Trichinella britovi]|uniref:Uncharacterized protein n=1 Tax=Trichinella britovi TaxID=45882 RepID=A0A0V1AJT0_TRIBR|nr:hypothetical protein T03_10850 [Trichinella britovi]
MLELRIQERLDKRVCSSGKNVYSSAYKFENSH